MTGIESDAALIVEVQSTTASKHEFQERQLVILITFFNSIVVLEALIDELLESQLDGVFFTIIGI